MMSRRIEIALRNIPRCSANKPKIIPIAAVEEISSQSPAA
jgi:hypothetical protein